jgi:hypothetical protein
VRHAWPAEATERGGVGEALRGEPVAEHAQGPDVAGDADRREGRPKLDEPRPKLCWVETIDRAFRTDRPDQPDGDHPIPLDRARRRALGRLGGEEQFDRPSEDQASLPIRCP